MKTKGLLFGLVAMLMSAVLLTSCQKEEELEDKLLQDCCWEGTLPIREHSGETKEYSRFFFYWENGYGYGIEDVYVRGEYSETYNFAWYWLDEPGGYKCLASTMAVAILRTSRSSGSGRSRLGSTDGTTLRSTTGNSTGMLT